MDDPRVVLREPQRFGTITRTRGNFPTHVRLNRIPTALTATEKEHMFHCERNGKTRGARYQNNRHPDMLRCPFADCGHSVINLRTVPASIGAHYREYHNSKQDKFCIHFSHKGKPETVRLPEEKDKKDTDQQPTEESVQKENEGTQEPPGRQRLRGCDKKYTQPKILDAMLRLRHQQPRKSTP